MITEYKPFKKVLYSVIIGLNTLVSQLMALDTVLFWPVTSFKIKPILIVVYVKKTYYSK